jgi:hypothetical protein
LIGEDVLDADANCQSREHFDNETRTISPDVRFWQILLQKSAMTGAWPVA